MSPDLAFVRPGPDWLPRLMVIDGCNVGRSACGLTREAVSCAGLLSVIRWLLLRDFDCVAFLPVVYNNIHNSNATQVQLLAKLEEVGLVTFTPARAGSGDRRAFINYDDLYVTTLAERHGGCVLSGDKFKDILAQPQYSAFHDVIRHRTLDVKFLFLPHEIVHFGDDVFYRAAPELFINEHSSTRAATISKIIHASPEDADFAKVAMRRQSFTNFRRQECIRICDDLIYELSEREALRPMRLHQMPSAHPRPSYVKKSSNFSPVPAADWTVARDDSVWQPSSIVHPYTSHTSGGAPSDEQQEVQQDSFGSGAAQEALQPAAPTEDMLLIDFSDEQPTQPNFLESSFNEVLSPSQLNASSNLFSSSSGGDPFDLVEHQLTSLGPTSDRLDQPVRTYAELAAGALSTQLDLVHLHQLEDELASAPIVSASFADENSTRTTSRFFPSAVSVREDVTPTAPPLVPIQPEPVPPLPLPEDAPTEPEPTSPIEPELPPTQPELSPTEPERNSPTDEEIAAAVAGRDHILSALSDIFPRDIVLSVLTMNGSSNLDFLAEQCLILASQ